MRTLLLLPFLFLMVSCYALKVIAIQTPLIDSSPFLNRIHGSGLIKKAEFDTASDFRLPVSSTLSPGLVKRQTLPGMAFSYPLFVVGDDETSRQWLQRKAKTLKRIHALGLVTNVANQEALLRLETLADMPLQPVNVDELASLLAVKHYPFVLQDGVLWQ